jgi:uncharacterized protein (DUF2235 family)
MEGKTIVLCSDRTGNTAIKTREIKLDEPVDIQGHKYDPTLTPQSTFYDEGKGTSRLVQIRLIGGAFGYRVAKKVRDFYIELVHVHVLGDHLYLFGLSRGVYMVRALSDLLQYCGILDIKRVGYKPLQQRVKDRWKAFRREAFKRVPGNERCESRPAPDASA